MKMASFLKFGTLFSVLINTVALSEGLNHSGRAGSSAHKVGSGALSHEPAIDVGTTKYIKGVQSILLENAQLLSLAGSKNKDGQYVVRQDRLDSIKNALANAVGIDLEKATQHASQYAWDLSKGVAQFEIRPPTALFGDSTFLNILPDTTLQFTTRGDVTHFKTGNIIASGRFTDGDLKDATIVVHEEEFGPVLYLNGKKVEASIKVKRSPRAITATFSNVFGDKYALEMDSSKEAEPSVRIIFEHGGTRSSHFKLLRYFGSSSL